MLSVKYALLFALEKKNNTVMCVTHHSRLKLTVQRSAIK